MGIFPVTLCKIYKRRLRLMPEMLFLLKVKKFFRSQFLKLVLTIPQISKLRLRQKPIETKVRQQITDGQTVPSDHAASHESVLQQLEHEMIQ